jgi:D-glycero-D-manno-heptose 1,7-bisphosphate phosphatase
MFGLNSITAQETKKNKSLFLDRDGVINTVLFDENKMPLSPCSIGEIEFTEGIKDVLEKAHGLGYLNILITNQPYIAYGSLKKSVLDDMHKFIRSELPLDDIFVCPHEDDDNCSCRKPKPGMLLDAAKKWNIDLSKSFMVGDTERDVGAGRLIGCKTVMVDAPYNQSINCDIRVKSVLEIIKFLK